MFPNRFDYVAASSLPQALELLGRAPDETKILAGGHSLLPALKLGLAEVKTLVDIGRLRELAYVRRDNGRRDDGRVRIGPLTTHATVERSGELAALLPILPEAAALIGDLQVRNRGTIGGSLAHGDPAADLPAVMLALEAELGVIGPGGERAIAADAFFVDLFATALRPDEILAEVRIPALPARTGTSYLKFPHPASRYAVCGVAGVVTLGANDRVERVRVGVTGVGAKAYRATAVEGALTGQPATAEAIGQAAQHAAAGADTLSDLVASAEYREHLARVYTQRALARAVERAQRA